MSQAALTLMVVTTTVASAEEAQRLAAQAVQARLAACVQVEAITSHYVWQGQAQAQAEWRLVYKTTPDVAAPLQAWLQAQHPYEVPQLLVQPVQSSASYAAWVAQAVTAPPL